MHYIITKDPLRRVFYIGKRKDITIRLGYLMDFGDGDFDITIQNTGKLVHSTNELDDEVIGKRLLHEAE